MINEFRVNSKIKIGNDNPCFIIAEAGVNHDGSVSKAKELVDVAVEAKANAVKFQMFKTDEYASDDAFLANYHKKGLIKKNENLKSLLRRLELSESQYLDVFEYAKKKYFYF